MATLPAFCDNCGSIFATNILSGNVKGLTMIGTLVGPCPACGEMGHVPDGVYDVFGSTIKLLQAPDSSVEEFKRFAELLKRAREEKTAPAEVVAWIGNELPKFTSILDILPQTRNEFYGFVSMIIATISLYLLLVQPNNQQSPTSNITIENVVHFAISEQGGVPTSAKPDPVLHHQKRPGRNEQCPCRSGKKYKHCHGATGA